jgi:hypothetical protein
MFKARLMLALVAALMLAGMMSGASSGAGTKSVQGRPHGSAARVHVGVSAKALPKRNLHDKLKEKASGLFIKGNVEPGWNNKNVLIHKATCKTCAFKRVGKARTNSEGKWKFRLSAPRKGNWFWKGFVKKAGAYGKSPTNYIYRTWR